MNKASLQLQDDGYPSGFWGWLRKNQHVYDAFRDRALAIARRGHKHCSAKYIVESLRYETSVTDTDIQFKLNNVFTSGMARLFMEQHGNDYPDFFRCRDSMGMDL